MPPEKGKNKENLDDWSDLIDQTFEDEGIEGEEEDDDGIYGGLVDEAINGISSLAYLLILPHFNPPSSPFPLPSSLFPCPLSPLLPSPLPLFLAPFLFLFLTTTNPALHFWFHL
jgi:hypothetical protein